MINQQFQAIGDEQQAIEKQGMGNIIREGLKGRDALIRNQ